MKTPGEWLSELKDEPGGPLRTSFSTLADLLAKALDEQAQEFAGVLWDACQEHDTRGAFERGAAMARGEIVRYLDERRRQWRTYHGDEVENRPGSWHAYDSRGRELELDTAIRYVGSFGPILPPPPNEIAVRVQAVIEWIGDEPFSSRVWIGAILDRLRKTLEDEESCRTESV